MTSTFPSSWKDAKVIPVPKNQSNRSSPEYRPISILPFLSKVFEKILHDQMLSFLKQNNLLCTNQSGYRNNHSCVSALLKVTDDLRCAMDQDYVSFLGLLDFSKAFDTVNHKILIWKMKRSFNFSDSAAKLILSYLSERRQAVVVGKQVSSFVYLFTGVPQGSILGPLLFSLYINDLPSQVEHSSIDLYADDVQIRLSCKLGLIENGASLLNEDLNKIMSWSEKNHLKLNPIKSKCLVIYKNELDRSYFPDIHVGNTKIEYVDKVKNLGIWFNSTLNWDLHIQTVIGRIYGTLRCLSYTKQFTPQNIRFRLAKTLILPIITYGAQIFCCLSSESTRNLNVAFNNITRYVYDLKRYDHVSEYKENLLGCTLNAYLNYIALKTINNIVVKKDPIYLFNKLTYSLSTRTFTFIQPTYTSLTTKRQFFVHVVRLWNSLPLDIRKLRGTLKFDVMLFRYLASNHNFSLN